MPGIIARAKQTSTTTGTGTVTLIAAPSNLRSFATQFGAGPVPVYYCIQGTSYFEIGKGTFTSAGSTLTRDTVFLNSNGTTIPITLPGAVHDVFAWAPPLFAPVTSFTGNKTFALSEVGTLQEFTENTARTFTLPALANVPDGTMIPIAVVGTADLTIDGNASELIEGATTFIARPGDRPILWKSPGTPQWRLHGVSRVLGSVIGRGYGEYTANADITATIPTDNTIPQSGEGVEIINVSYTPRSATSRIRARFQGQAVAATSAFGAIAALFRDSVANALRATVATIPGNGFTIPLVLEFEHAHGGPAGTAIAYKIRAGSSNGATIRFNGGNAAAFFGGAQAATLVLEEIEA